MKGIYKFQNKINNKIYIGKSIQLEIRFEQHKRNAFNPNSHSYNSAFYSAIRKYGFDNFKYTILIEDDNFTNNDLSTLEIFYIDKYNSYYDGYNETKGGDGVNIIRTLNEQDVIKIKELLLNTRIKINDIANTYNISSSLVSSINTGKAWISVGHYNYPIRKRNQYAHQGERNSHSLSSDKEILLIRLRFVNETLNEIYEDFKNKYSFSGIKKICYGVTNKHLPIYKKHEKKWYLNGTCIDYPRLEE